MVLHGAETVKDFIATAFACDAANQSNMDM
jgi:hypothetical protein